MSRASDAGDRLYVVMELIEGEPLAEHFASLREKQQRFTEERIWNIFIQVDSVLFFFKLVFPARQMYCDKAF